MSYWEGGGAVGGVWLPGGGGGGPALVQSVSGATSGATGVAVSFASPVTAGNLLYILEARRNQGISGLQTDFAQILKGNAIGPSRAFALVNPNAYAQIRLADIAGPDCAAIGYRVATGDEQTLYFSRTGATFLFWEVSGAALGTPVWSTAQVAAGTKSLGAFPVAGRLSLGVYLWDTGDGAPPAAQVVGAGWTLDLETQSGFHPGSLQMHGTGYPVPSVSGPSLEWGGVAVTF